MGESYHSQFLIRDSGDVFVLPVLDIPVVARVVVFDVIAGLEVLVGVTHEVFHAFFGSGIIVDWRWRCAVNLSWRHIEFGMLYQVVQTVIVLRIRRFV